MNKLPVLLLAYILVLLGCSKDSTKLPDNIYPSVAVKIDINLSLPQYNSLALPQGWVYEDGGNKGVIVYHTTNDDFVAFDRACPVTIDSPCAFVSVDSGSFFYRCSYYPNSKKNCSGGGFCLSRFDAATGTPLSGPAAAPLKQYYVRRDGSFVHISSSPL